MHPFNFSASIILSGLISFGSLFAALPKKSLSLQSAIEFAVEQNFSIKKQKAQVDKSFLQEKELSYSFYPRVDFIAEMQTTKDSSKFIGYGLLSQSIFNGFRDTLSVDISKQRAVQNKSELKRLIFNLGLEVEDKFHDLLYYKDLLALKLEASLKNSSDLKLVRRSKSSGLSSQADLLLFELKSSLLQSEVVYLEQRLEASQVELNILFSHDNPQDPWVPLGKLRHQHLNRTLEYYIDLYSYNNYSLKQRRLSLEIADLEKRIAATHWLPQIDLSLKSGFLPQEDRDPTLGPSFSSEISLGLTFNFFGGFRNYYQTLEAEKEKLSLAHDLKQSIFEHMGLIKSYFLHLKSIEKRVDLEKSNSKLAEKYYQNIKKEYLRGFKNSADLADAHDKYFDSLQREITFKRDFLKTKIKFENTLGAKADVTIVAD